MINGTSSDYWKLDCTPMANAMLTLMHKLGFDNDSFGDSTGPFSFSETGSATTDSAL